MIILLLPDCSVYVQLYLHFLRVDTINMLFICLAIHTDKCIYPAPWLQSGVSSRNGNHPVSAVGGREATLGWGLAEPILLCPDTACNCRQVLRLRVLLPFLFALTGFEARVASFLVSL